MITFKNSLPKDYTPNPETIHLLPFDLKKSIKCNVDSMFNSTIKQDDINNTDNNNTDNNNINIEKMDLEDNNNNNKIKQQNNSKVLQNSLYGRKLLGNNIQLPENTKMLVFDKKKGGVMEEKDLYMTEKLDNFYYWKHDDTPQDSDIHHQNIALMEALQAFHSE